MTSEKQLNSSRVFQTLHQSGCFVVPNPWDAGSAKILESIGFKGLATTSAGYAFSRGKPDFSISRDEMMQYLSSIVEATSIPISVDLQNGFGDKPEEAAKTVMASAECGAVGGSIEDATGVSDKPLYDISYAAERIRACAEAASKLPFKYMLTARAENNLYGNYDVVETIARLQAYQDAGADVLFAPGLKTLEDIRTVVKNIDRPLNVIAGLSGTQFTVSDLAKIGVRRISVGGSLARYALAALTNAAKEMHEQGTFHYADNAIPGNVLHKIFSSHSSN